jgi:predicted PurR-regulated permease PerM
MPDLIQRSTAALFGTINIILVFVAALIIPVFALYLLIDFDRIVQRFQGLIPRRWAPLAGSVAFEVHRTLGGYVRGQLTACAVLSALYAGGLTLAGLRLAIPIGVFTGMLAFVPYVGFGIGVSMAVAIALLDWHGVDNVLAVVAVMFLVQILDGMAVTPRIVGKSVGLRPIEVLLTMMAAATLFGFLGVLLAVPLGAVVKILLSRATTVYLGSDFYLRPPAPVEAAGPPLTELAQVKTGSVPPSRTAR